MVKLDAYWTKSVPLSVQESNECCGAIYQTIHHIKGDLSIGQQSNGQSKNGNRTKIARYLMYLIWCYVRVRHRVAVLACVYRHYIINQSNARWISIIEADWLRRHTEALLSQCQRLFKCGIQKYMLKFWSVWMIFIDNQNARYLGWHKTD